jgi:hypothetical protein
MVIHDQLKDGKMDITPLGCSTVIGEIKLIPEYLYVQWQTCNQQPSFGRQKPCGSAKHGKTTTNAIKLLGEFRCDVSIRITTITTEMQRRISSTSGVLVVQFAT